MAVRKHPTKGPGWWQIRISHGRNGKEETFPYEGTELEALAYEAELRGIPQESAHQRLKDIIGRFLDWYTIEKAARTVDEAGKTLPKVIAALNNQYINLLRQSDYNRYKAKRLADGVTKRTINAELSYLRSLLNFASDGLKLQIGELPKLYTKKQTLPPPKTPLTPDELARLLNELDGDKRTIVTLYTYCALRRTEALQLKRKSVDLEAGLIHVTGKGNKHRIVPIIGQDLLEQLIEVCRDKKNDDYLFINKRTGEPYQDLKKGLKLAAERAGITKPVWNHLMRHSGATAAIQAGVGLRSLQAMLGHSDIRMTEVYTHMSADLLKIEASKMAELHKTASGMSGTKKTEKSSKISKLKKRINNS